MPGVPLAVTEGVYLRPSKYSGAPNDATGVSSGLVNPADFLPSMPGRLVPTVKDASAFTPDPLPPTIEWSTELVRANGDAERALGELGGVGRFWGNNPHVLIRPFLRRE